MSIKHAIKWSFFAELASKVVTPLVFVILARLLTPEDFGVVAAATMVISFSQIFWEAGMSKAYIQYQGDRDAGANAAFWLNNALGALVAFSLIAVAPEIAERVFHDSRVSLVLRVLALQVFLSALGSIHTAHLRKDMHFKQLFWVRLLTVSLPGLTSIPLAAMGMGYWSLIVGTLAGQLMQVIVLWRISSWRPSFTFDKDVARSLVKFGLWVAVTGLLTWFFLWADSLLVAMYFGAHSLGLYRTGHAFVLMFYSVFFSPMLPVLYSHFAQIQQDPQRVKHVLDRVVRFVTFVSIPVGIGLYAFSEAIEVTVFSEQWKGIAPVIALMALSQAFAWTVGANGEAYRAIGRPDFETKIMAASVAVYAIAYLVSVQYGFAVFLWTKVGLTAVGIAIHLSVAHAALAFPIVRTLTYILKVSISFVPLAVISHYFSDAIFSPTWFIAFAVAGTLGLGYLWLLERRSLIPETLNLLRSRVRPRTT